MITGIIQILALVVLYYLLRRASKQDLVKELELKDHIRTEIKNAVTILSTSFEQALSLSINTCEAHLKQQADENQYWSLQRIDNLGMGLGDIVKPLPDRLEDLHKDVNLAYDSLSSSLITIAEKQFQELTSRLTALEAPILNLTETLSTNAVKDGEARRTLHKRIQERDTAISNMQTAMENLSRQNKDYEETLSVMKQTASSFLAELNNELSFIRSWMESKGMPVSALDKALAAEFKGEVPSQIYARAQNEKLLAAAVNA